MARRWRALCGAFVVLAAACLAACGAGPRVAVLRRQPAGHRDFGSRVLVREMPRRSGGRDTVMRLVQRNAKVDDALRRRVRPVHRRGRGRAARRAPGGLVLLRRRRPRRPRGRLRPRGRRRRRLVGPPRLGIGAGERPAVVGSFPAPFTPEAVLRESLRARRRARRRGRRSRARARASGPSRRRRSAAAPSPACSSGPAPRSATRRSAACCARARKAAASTPSRARDGTSIALLDPRGKLVRAAGRGRRARRRDARRRASSRSGRSRAPTTPACRRLRAR